VVNEDFCILQDIKKLHLEKRRIEAKEFVALKESFLSEK